MYMDWEKELNRMKVNIGLSDDMDCTKEENAAYAQILKEGGKLPENVFQYKTMSGEYLDAFYKIENSTLSGEKIREYIQLKQYQELKTIRRCMVFLTSLIIVNLILIFLGIMI